MQNRTINVHTAERRRSRRAPAAYAACLRDARGRLLARGRTADISESGLFAIVRACRAQLAGEVMLEITVPGLGANPRRRDARTVAYRCWVVRTQPIGQLLGIGLKFIEKLA